MDDDADGEKQNRVLLRPWLENMLENRNIPGLEWFDEDKTMFKVPWKHRSKKDWSMRHSSVFLEWAKNTGRWSEGDPAPNFAQLKTRLRCAFNKAPDIDEMKEHHYSKGEEPYKVYRFNTRRGEVKSVFGRKTCQKTAGKQGHRSRSPLVMKYESCEEEVIEDDYALYEDNMEVHSTVPTSKSNMSGAGQPMEESFQRNIIFTRSDNLMHANALFTSSGWAFGRDGGSADSQNDIRDSKSPIIPLTVEMMMCANGDSDCDGDSPKKSWNRPAENSSGHVGNSVKAIKREGSSGKIHEAETPRNSTPGADGSTDRMHLLQMASLFVEAAERQKQEDVVVEETPTEQVASVESAENFTPAKHYVIIMPSSYGKEVENMEQINEGNVTSGYVTPTGIEAIDLTVQTEDSNVSSVSKDNVKHLLELKVSSRIDSADASHLGSRLQLRDFTEISPPKQPVCEPEEAVDLTKSAVLTKCAEMVDHQAVSLDLADEVKVPMPAVSLESKGNRDSEARRNYAVLTDGYTEDEAYTSVETCEHSTFEQMSHLSIEQLAIKARRLHEWEKRLKSWEMQLQAKEETLYWRDRCLQSEMGTKAAAYHIPSEGVIWNKERPPVHIASQAVSVSSLPFTRFRPTTPCTLATPKHPAVNMPVVTPNLPGAIATRLVATHNLPIVTPNRPGATPPSRPVASPNLPVASPQLETGAPVTSNSELKQRLAQMIIKSNRLPSLRMEGGSPAVRQYVDTTPTSVQPLTTVPSSVSGGVAVGSRPFMGHPVAAEPYSVSAGSQQQPIPLVSLIRPNKGMPMIVPVLGGSQPMLLVPRHLVPVAMAMQAQAVQSETHDVLLKSHLETTHDGKVTTESHELNSRKSEKDSSLEMETNVETDAMNVAVLAPSQSKRDDSSPEAEITTSVSNQEPKESSPSKHSATPNSRCSSLTRLGSDTDADDRNDHEEFLESHPATDSVNGVKCGEDETANEPTTMFKNNTRSRNVSGKSTASDPCEKTSAENLSILPSVSGNEGVGKMGNDNEGVVSSRKDVKLPESVQKQLAGHGSLLDFTKWLREKTETICKEESQEGRKAAECSAQVQLCSDNSSSKEKFEQLNLINIPPFASIKIVNSGSSTNGGMPCSDSLVSTQGSQSVSPVSSPNVPLVVEHENDFLEKEGEDEEAFSANESPLNNRKQTNLSSRRKRSCEKQNVFKKARVDC